MHYWSYHQSSHSLEGGIIVFMTHKNVEFAATKTVARPATVKFKTKSGKTVEFRAVRTFERARKFTVVIERDEDGFYMATVPSLPGCHTQSKNLDTLMKRVREVVSLCR